MVSGSAATAKAHQAMIQQSLSYMNKGDYDRQSQLTAIGKYMQKHRKGFSFDPNNIWQLAYERNRAKLAIMLLLYLFFNDDDIVSKNEEKLLKKMIKQEKIFLNKEDSVFLQSLAGKKPTLLTFTEYLETNKLKQDIFDAAVKTNHKYIKQKSIYKTMLDKLEKSISEVIAIK